MILILVLLLVSYVPVNTPTIFIVGDSLTYGLYASEESTTYRNLGANDLGYQLDWCYAPRLQNVADCWEDSTQDYDYVVLEVGLNDVSQPTMSDGTYAVVYADMVQSMQGAGAIVVTTSMFHAVAPSHANYGRYLQYNEIIANSGGLFADVWSYTEACTDCLSFIDGFHPNDKGHRMIADKIVATILGQNKIFLPLVISEGKKNEQS